MTTLALATPHGPLLAGSRFPLLRTSQPDVRFVLIGPGRIEGATYIAPDRIERAGSAFVVAAGTGTAGIAQLLLAPAPANPTSLIAVASYDDGIAFQRRSDGTLAGILATDGGVADVTRAGDILFAAATEGDAVWRVDLKDLHLSRVPGAATANEIVIADGVTYITQRDVGGLGALTRIGSDGVTSQVITGATAEGLALDRGRGRAYIANVNDATVVALDLTNLRVVRRYTVPERPFGIALDAKRDMLYVTSNRAPRPGLSGGGVVALDLADGRIRARSKPLVFPLGVVYDALRDRVFVTDEASGSVSVLDGRSLAEVKPSLKACTVPWRPAIDPVRRRLYVPCATANALAVFDLDRLRPLEGTPYATGGYPLGVAP